jgi:hypothetical protein
LGKGGNAEEFFKRVNLCVSAACGYHGRLLGLLPFSENRLPDISHLVLLFQKVLAWLGISMEVVFFFFFFLSNAILKVLFPNCV